MDRATTPTTTRAASSGRSRPRSRSRLRDIGIAGTAAVLAVGLFGSPQSPDRAGGSLPLAGEEFPAGDGGAADGYASGTGSHWNVLNWAPGMPAAVPTSFSYNTVDDSGRTVKRILVGTQSNPDVGSAASNNNLSYSDDGGKTFLTTARQQPTSAANMIRLDDGSLFSIDFIPEWEDPEHSYTNLIVHRSRDGGKTWTTRKAPVSMPSDIELAMSNGGRVHRRIIQLDDGILMVPLYTVFAGSSRGRSIILQSTDNGRSWSFRSEIPAPATPGINEVGWSYTSDGRLTAVVRTTDSPARLAQSFSDDDGQTWSEAQYLIGPDGQGVVGIYPDLVLQPNGILMLTTGRPDVRILVDYDGTGQSWDELQTVFANYPATGNNGRYDGSSGNNTMENVDASTSVLFYDQCHVWGCGAYNQQFGVSAEYVSAVTPGTGRIDIASKLADGTAEVAGTFARRDRHFPEQRPAGAFDGSSADHAEAVLAARRSRAPQMMLTLDRTYTLDKIGLMLGHGTDPESATVSVSTDRVNWTEVAAATDRLDRAMRYTEFDPQPARYVKVTGPVGERTTVTELELYAADLDTFENELPFSVPRGWTDAEHTWVTDVPADPAYSDIGGHHSATALRLWDKFTKHNAHITRPAPDTDHLYATMQWATADTRAPFTATVNTTAPDGSTVAAWQFRLTQGSPATLEAFDGSNWQTVGRLSDELPSKEYLPLTIDATATEAAVTIGEDYFATDVRATAQVPTLTGLTFSTGDPAGYGGIYYLDDVKVGSSDADAPLAPPTVADLTGPAAATPGEPFTVATTVTNTSDLPATDLVTSLSTPDGWQVDPVDAPSEVPAGGSVPVSWSVTPSGDTAAGLHPLTASATFSTGEARLTGTSATFEVGIGLQPAGLRTFDDEPVGEPPAQATTTGSVTVQEVTVDGATTRAVRVHDDSSSSMAKLVIDQGSSPSRRFEFDIMPTAQSQPTIVAVHGTGSSSGAPWRFLIRPEPSDDGAANVSAYDGSSWVRLGVVPGLHDRDGWAHVSIVATTEQASLTANGVELTTADMASAVTAIGGLEVASSGTAPVGTDTYIDNLDMVTPSTG